jgi:hypothetical protein
MKVIVIYLLIYFARHSLGEGGVIYPIYNFSKVKNSQHDFPNRPYRQTKVFFSSV